MKRMIFFCMGLLNLETENGTNLSGNMAAGMLGSGDVNTTRLGYTGEVTSAAKDFPASG